LHDGLIYPSISENAWRRNEGMLSDTWCDGPESHNESLILEHSPYVLNPGL